MALKLAKTSPYRSTEAIYDPDNSITPLFVCLLGDCSADNYFELIFLFFYLFSLVDKSSLWFE